MYYLQALFKYHAILQIKKKSIYLQKAEFELSGALIYYFLLNKRNYLNKCYNLFMIEKCTFHTFFLLDKLKRITSKFRNEF